MAEDQDSRLIELLRKYEVLDQGGIDGALAAQSKAKGDGKPVPLAAVLVQRQIIPFQQVDRLVAHQKNEPISCKSCKTQTGAGSLDPREPFLCPSCGEILPETDTTLDAFGTMVSETTDAPAATGLLGTRIAGCKIERKIGEGGMGAVYKGTHEHLNREVAVKVLPEYHLNRPGFAERFLRESRSAAKILHPNIVQVMDAGVEGKTHYIIMEFVEGKSLEEILDEKGRLPIQEALRYVRDAARGLKEAWDHGVIHRDIKPDNIRISKKGVAKVADFGLAKDLESTLKISLTGAVMGTPLYMSPEQARGEKVDFRSDIYSLGATLYHLLVGKPPFKGASALVVMQKHTEEDPKPITTTIEECPPEVEKLVQKMMAKSPDDRFASYGELIEAMDEILGSAATVTDGAQAPAGSGKKAVGIIAAAAIVLAIAGWALTRGGGDEKGPSQVGVSDTAETEPILRSTDGGEEDTDQAGGAKEEGKSSNDRIVQAEELTELKNVERQPYMGGQPKFSEETLFFVDAHDDEGLRSKFSDFFGGLGLKITEDRDSASHTIDLAARFDDLVHPVEKTQGTRLSLRVKFLEVVSGKELLSQSNEARYASDFSTDAELRHDVVIDKALKRMKEKLEKKVTEKIKPLLKEGK